MVVGKTQKHSVALAENVIDAEEVLVAYDLVWNGADHVDVQHVLGIAIGQRKKLVNKTLRVFIDPAGGNDVGDFAGAVAERLSGQRIVDNDRCAHGLSIYN